MMISSMHHCDVVRKPSDLSIIMSYTMEHWNTTIPTQLCAGLSIQSTYNLSMSNAEALVFDSPKINVALQSCMDSSYVTTQTLIATK